MSEQPSHDTDAISAPHSSGAVLLVHGITGAPDELAPLRDSLAAAGYRVLLPLLAGHGTSIEEMKRVRLETWRGQVRAAYSDLAAGHPERLLVGGISFGALLALDAALSADRAPDGVVLLSPPFRLRKTKNELLLRALSLLPDVVLDALPAVPKPLRDPSLFVMTRNAYSAHAIGAIARIFRLRRYLARRLASLHAPVLTIIAPDDHHLDPVSAMLARRYCRGSRFSMQRYLPGGEHELTIGPRYDAVNAIVHEFIDRIVLERTGTAAARSNATSSS